MESEAWRFSYARKICSTLEDAAALSPLAILPFGRCGHLPPFFPSGPC